MLHAAVIALSSFLLFLVQPLIARLILPWFGGSAAVWTTCMLFFQVLLLAGYAYAHAANTRLTPRWQAIVHTVLLAAAAATLPIAPDPSWKPDGTDEPVTRILLLLGASVGLPYLVLASTSPLLQAWFARTRPGENPYRLFAVSNAASLAALIGYPFAIEPFLGGGAQVGMWSWMFGAFALACAALAWVPGRVSLPGAASIPAEEDPGGRIPRADLLLWLALSATGSALLLAVTNHITQNIAAIPLLWLAPLTLYLLTFILAFEGRNLYRPRWFWSVCLVWLIGMAWLLIDTDRQFEMELQLAMYLSGLAVACFFCHGELYERRPAARHLTAFYLTISAGGALGGLFVAVLAPLVFIGYHELGICLAVCALLSVIRCRQLGAVPGVSSLAVLMAVTGASSYEIASFRNDVNTSARNFYGVLRVKEYGAAGEPGHMRRLLHWVIMHGEQYLDPEHRGQLTTYYQTTSGVGMGILSKQEHSVRVGVIGLGAGTLAGYGRAGDVFRFYDINPEVVRIAREKFTYLGDSGAKIDIVLGDARLSMEREAPQGYDVLAVDAFSSDAIPVHLITREALALYLRHVKPDGIVAFHVSNRFLNLGPVVARLAQENGAQVTGVYEKGGTEEDSRTTSDWILVSRDAAALDHAAIKDAEDVDEKPEWRTWTDDYSNLVHVLK
ncbi:MAG: fused MFS/spermidine synthase [Betaproteobacteria bacterium]|nr:fused MFS/spermidine synthase [Betaproteobacteria bacterium]